METSWELRGRGRKVSVRVWRARGEPASVSDEALTAAESARRLGRSRRQIYRFLRAGTLPAVGKFLGEWLFDAGSVRRFHEMSKLARIPLRRPLMTARFKAFFPEYRLEDLNAWTNAPVIITRLLDLGGRVEWKWVLRHYPLRLVRAVLRRHGARLMSERSHHFWCFLFPQSR